MTQNKVKIAITGGMGSGKSTVLKIIKEVDYPAFSCDEIYAELLKDEAFLSKLSREFGGILNERGELDRRALSAVAFSSEENLKKLNSLTHPAIMQAALKKMDEYNLSFLEVPLLFENNFEGLFSGVIVVLRDREERINSVINRSSLTRDEVEMRLKRQFDYENSSFAQYYVIHNSGNLQSLREKTLKVIKNFI